MRKITVTVCLDQIAHQRCRERHLNISKICNDALIIAVGKYVTDNASQELKENLIEVDKTKKELEHQLQDIEFQEGIKQREEIERMNAETEARRKEEIERKKVQFYEVLDHREEMRGQPHYTDTLNTVEGREIWRNSLGLSTDDELLFMVKEHIEKKRAEL